MNEPTEAVVAVTALLLRERQSRDRARWSEMAACYTADATIAMSWFDGAATDFIERSRTMDVGGSRGVHRLSPPAVRVHGDRAWAELPLVIEFRTDVAGVQADLCSFARSQYRAVRTDQGWQIRSITSVYERDTLTPRRSRNGATAVPRRLRRPTVLLPLPRLASGSQRLPHPR